MAKHADNESRRETCRGCGSALNTGAVRCLCGAWQDWRFHLTSMETICALVVGLVSVLTVGIPLVIGSLKPAHDSVTVRISRVDPFRNEMAVFAANEGRRAAVVRSIVVVPPHAVGMRSGAQLWDLALPDDCLVDRESVREIVCSARGFQLPTLVESTDPGERYRVEIELLRSTGQIAVEQLEFRGAVIATPSD